MSELENNVLKRIEQYGFNRELHERVAKHLAEHPETSIAEFAKQIGYSRTAVSKYASVAYMNPVGVERAVRAWFRKQDRLAADTFVPTVVARMISEACQYAVAENEMVVVYGPPGVGKTTGVRRFLAAQAKAGDANFVFVTANPTTSYAVLLRRIADEMGLNSGFAAPILGEKLVAALKRSPHLIVVDDASFLHLRALETLRYLHDQAAAGIVLVGTRALMLRLLGASGRLGEELAQFYERVGLRVELPPSLAKAELAAIARAHDPSLTEAEVGRVLARPRGPRGMVKLLRRLDSLRAIEQPEGVTFADLLATAEQQIFEAA